MRKLQSDVSHHSTVPEDSGGSGGREVHAGGHSQKAWSICPGRLSCGSHALKFLG